MATATDAIESPALRKLNNRLFIVRHGQALSNVQSLIVSDIEIGGKEYGITDLGRQQAVEASQKLQELLSSEQDLSNRLVILSSDFLRTKQTAEIIHSHLHPDQPIRYEPLLRERWYGTLDMTKIRPDTPIRQLDKADPLNKKYNHETIMDVILRMSRLVQQLDNERKGCIYIIVSHGDPLQLLHTIFLGLSPEQFLDHPYITNGEIRELIDS